MQAQRAVEEDMLRAQEEAWRAMHGEEQPQALPPPPPPEEERGTPEERMEMQLLLARFTCFDVKALAALNALAPESALKCLRDFEAKSASIRNPSAWICRTAQNVKERNKRGHTSPTRSDQGQDAHAQVQDLVDHYAALEVEPSAEEAVVKKAYRKLVLKWHPDKHPEDRDKAEEMIRAINNAYETLSNPTKRSTYDAQRLALERLKRGLGPDQSAMHAPRQRIPKEFMLQPIGYPDKFVRYAADRPRAQCFVHSRADARLEGMSGLEQFVPFFKACKLSIWWLPTVNNMCRVRALEARTRSTKGAPVGAGMAGGLNLGFDLGTDDALWDSGLQLVDARKGEKNEQVNFIVEPSPMYDSAFRFEAAYRRGYFLAFWPPQQLRMVPYSGGQLPGGAVLDFTLVDFQTMFKFIDIEEVLRPVLESYSGWVSLDQVKTDPNVVAYFANILQKPMWDDDDFATYFDGHFETWEHRATTGGNAVRLRGPEERLGFALARAKGADEASELIIEAGEDLRRLNRCNLAVALEVLAEPGSEEVSKAVRRVDANRRVLTALGGVLAATEPEDVAFSELARLAEALRCEGASPDVAARLKEANQYLAKLVLARIAAAERRGNGGPGVFFRIKLEEIGPLLALPGVAAVGAAIAKCASPPLAKAPPQAVLGVLATAKAAGAEPLMQMAAEATLDRVNSLPSAEAAAALRAVAVSGAAPKRCAAALERRASSMENEELATTVAVLAERGCDSSSLAAAANELALRGAALARLPAVGLLALAVAATKTVALAGCLGRIADAAASTLRTWPAADAIKLLLAMTKAKGELQPSTRASLLREVAAAARPCLAELPAAELVRLALAAGGGSGGGADAVGLLEAVAGEVANRLSDLPQAHLLLLTQGLAPLGGQHAALRRICSFWGEVLREGGGAGTDAPDLVSARRKDIERGQALSAEHLAKLAAVLASLADALDSDTSERCFVGLGARLIASAAGLSRASATTLLEQISRGEGVGRWEAGRERLRRALSCGGGGGAGVAGGGSSSSRPCSRTRSRSRKCGSRSTSRSRSRSRCRRRSPTLQAARCLVGRGGGPSPVAAGCRLTRRSPTPQATRCPRRGSASPAARCRLTRRSPSSSSGGRRPARRSASPVPCHSRSRGRATTRRSRSRRR